MGSNPQQDRPLAVPCGEKGDGAQSLLWPATVARGALRRDSVCRRAHGVPGKCREAPPENTGAGAGVCPA